MYPYLFSNQRFPMYGVMMAAGIAAAFLILFFYGKKSRIKRDDRLFMGTFALIGGILGAKVLSILTNIRYIIENNLSFFDVLTSGFVFYGGLIGGVAGIAIYAAVFKINLLDLLDIAAVILPLAQFFGRLGCFFAGCCYGRQTNSFIGIVFDSPTANPYTPLGVPLLPTQLFEGAYCLILFAALFILSRKNMPRGLLVSVYSLVYSICRFANEFFRGDGERGFIGVLSTSQFISILVFAFGACMLGFCIYRAKKGIKIPEPKFGEGNNTY